MAPILTPKEAKAFYDRLGARQDWQGFYENPARRDLVAHAGFETAAAVFEFGCGTGRFAAQLLGDHLPGHCSYAAVDVSGTMVGLARRHLAPWRDRARVDQASGSMKLDAADGAFDRFVTTYVLDLLSDADIQELLAEAHRVLGPDGRLCLVGLTHGRGAVTSLLSRLWMWLHARRPALLGGCRPIALGSYLDPGHWRIAHHRVCTAFAISSEVVVAYRVAPEDH